MRTNRLKTDLARIKKVIEDDRKGVSGDVMKMLKYDLMCVLGGYFENATPPEVEIFTDRGGVKLRVTASAKSVRSIGISPDFIRGVK